MFGTEEMIGIIVRIGHYEVVFRANMTCRLEIDYSDVDGDEIEVMSMKDEEWYARRAW